MSRDEATALSYRCRVAERRVVKVMWDHEAFPLWVTAGRPGQASSRGVPVSDDLARQLEAWSDELTSLMWGPNGPDARGWEGPDPDDLAAVNARGRALAILVRGELDDSWDVTYFDEALGKAVEVAPNREPVRRRHHH